MNKSKMLCSRLVSISQASVGLRLTIRCSSGGWSALRSGNIKRHLSKTGVFVALASAVGVVVQKLADEKGSSESVNTKSADREKSLQTAIAKARDLTLRLKDEVGTSGISVAVSVNGQEVWSEGFGYADMENRVLCHSHTVMRIASISKSMTMAIVGRLMEQGKLDIDKPVQHYLPDYSPPIFSDKKETVTTRMLLSHMGGIRHYDKNCGRKTTPPTDNSNKTTPTTGNNSVKSDNKLAGENNQQQQQQTQDSSVSSTSSSDSIAEFDNQEYYLAKKFKSVRESLALFEKDELCSKPGTEYLYTTHGWTLVSAVTEAAAGVKFSRLFKRMFLDLGLTETCLDKNEPIIYGRSKYYVRNKRGTLVNAPHVDNSYKWAGGGVLSTVHDLVRFGNVMLYSYQHIPATTAADKQSSSSTDGAEVSKYSEGQQASSSVASVSTSLPGYLRQDTVIQMWTPVKGAMTSKQAAAGRVDAYGLGWFVAPQRAEYGYGAHVWHHAEHTGAAVGASSVLLILPLGPFTPIPNSIPIPPASSNTPPSTSVSPPEGVVVAILTNLQGVGLKNLALDIAHVFRQATSDSQRASGSA